MAAKETKDKANISEIVKLDFKRIDGKIEIIESNFEILELTDANAVIEVDVNEKAMILVEDEKIKHIAKTLNIKGFRPGKVPLNVVKSKYKDAVTKEVLESVVSGFTSKILRDKKITPADEPKIDIVKFESNSLKFKIDVEIYPEVKIPDFSKIKLEKPTFEIKEKEIDEAINKIVRANTEFEKKDSKYKAKLNDAVIIDYEGKVDGEKFDGGTSKNHQLVLGSKSFIDNFEEQLVGVKEGDSKLVKVKFPDPYHADKLAGKKAEFEVKIIEVKSPIETKIDDEFAKKFGIETLEELKSKIKEQLESEYNQLADTKMRKELFDKLELECKFTAPKSMLDREFQNLWSNYQGELARTKAPAEKSEDEAKKEYEKIASRRVKLGILLAEIGKLDKIEITQQEIQQAIISQLKLYPGMEQKVFDFYQKNPSAVEQLKGPILENKVVQKIISQTSLEEKKFDLEELKEFAE